MYISPCMEYGGTYCSQTVPIHSYTTRVVVTLDLGTYRVVLSHLRRGGGRPHCFHLRVKDKRTPECSRSDQQSYMNNIYDMSAPLHWDNATLLGAIRGLNQHRSFDPSCVRVSHQLSTDLRSMSSFDGRPENADTAIARGGISRNLPEKSPHLDDMGWA